MKTTIYFDRMSSPLGTLLLVATDHGLAGVHFDGQQYEPVVGSDWQHTPEHPVLRAAEAQLTAYFAGRRTTFELPLAPVGTPFQRAVWAAIATVRCGETLTYGELAARAGAPKSVRAAGAATGRNPLGIVVPCHRIIGANGALTGYAGGLERKRALLALEASLAPLAPLTSFARAA
jgi:methylated-DNA-[protein]-cysteine S-methyltransferase